MTVLLVPALDAKPWPSLGPGVCAFIETHLTFGPGDLLGQPARIDDEGRGLIYRAYEVHPRCHRVRGRGVVRARGEGWCHDEEWRDRDGNPCPAGRRRFSRVAWSLRKGSAKTEKASWIALCELSIDGPVRTVGWDSDGSPIGGGVVDPYIPMVAHTEEQSEELAFGAMRAILTSEGCDLGRDFDIGLERIMRIDGHGKAQPLATAPKSRDGARTTFQHFDETWHMTLPRHKGAHRAMLANIPKRWAADAWSLETSTAPIPGQGSVAEDTMAYARAIHEGRIKEPTLFYFHRQASDHHDLNTDKGRRAAVREASGPAAKWSNLTGILEQWKDPKADRKHLEQTWLNRPVKGSATAFDAALWAKLAKPGYVVPAGALIALAFDGSVREDATTVIGQEIETGHLFVVGAWERPIDHDGQEVQGWEVPEALVNEAVDHAFETWDVWRFYCDPPYWESTVAGWSGKYGEQRVVAWRTNQWKRMAYACRAFDNAIRDAQISHDGNELLARHVANAHRMDLKMRAEDGKPLWVIQKERKDSPLKMDGAATAVLANQARLDALALGVGQEVEVSPSVYVV